MYNNGRTVNNRLCRNKGFRFEIRSLSKSLTISNVLRLPLGNYGHIVPCPVG